MEKAKLEKDFASYQRGKVLFNGEAACFGCHGADGAGMPNLGPPLDDSEWVTGKPEALVKILLHGMTGPVVVDGETYSPTADMPGLSMNSAMTDQSGFASRADLRMVIASRTTPSVPR